MTTSLVAIVKVQQFIHCLISKTPTRACGARSLWGRGVHNAPARVKPSRVRPFRGIPSRTNWQIHHNRGVCDFNGIRVMWTRSSLASGLRAKIVVIGNRTLLAPQLALHGEPQVVAPAATYWVFVGPARRLHDHYVVHAPQVVATKKEVVAIQEVRQVPRHKPVVNRTGHRLFLSCDTSTVPFHFLLTELAGPSDREGSAPFRRRDVLTLASPVADQRKERVARPRRGEIIASVLSPLFFHVLVVYRGSERGFGEEGQNSGVAELGGARRRGCEVFTYIPRGRPQASS